MTHAAQHKPHVVYENAVVHNTLLADSCTYVMLFAGHRCQLLDSLQQNKEDRSVILPAGLIQAHAAHTLSTAGMRHTPPCCSLWARVRDTTRTSRPCQPQGTTRGVCQASYLPSPCVCGPQSWAPSHDAGVSAAKYAHSVPPLSSILSWERGGAGIPATGVSAPWLWEHLPAHHTGTTAADRLPLISPRGLLLTWP